jgi:hypothetical protein
MAKVATLKEQETYDHFPRYPKLRNADAKIPITQEQFLEIARCTEDPIYFIRTYCKIIHVDLGVVDFDLYEYQERIVNLVVDERQTILKCPRQSGKTETITAVILWHMRFSENPFQCALLAHKETQAKQILTRLKRMAENLPVWMQTGVLVWNKSSIEFENGSSAIAAATSSGAIRGLTLNCVAGNTNITVRNKKTGIIETLTIAELQQKM